MRRSRTLAIARSMAIRNVGAARLDVTTAMSWSLDLPDGDWRMVQLSGAWARERHVHERHADRVGLLLLRGEGVRDEGGPGEHHVVARAQEGGGEVRDRHVGAGARRDHVGREAVRGGECGAIMILHDVTRPCSIAAMVALFTE